MGFFPPSSSLLKIWERGYDSEEVGEPSFQPRRKLQRGSCFGLFAIMNKQPGSQRAGFGGRRHTFLRGDEHRSRVASRWTRLRNQASRPFTLKPACMCLLWYLNEASLSPVYPPRETRTNPPPPRLLREVRGQRRRPSSSPEAARELVGGQSARLPSKRFPTSPFRAHKHTTGSWPNNLISGSI